jgi:hypothetical protein
MSQAKSTLTTTARIRFPNEFLSELDSWAAAHGYPRSVAVRVLIMRGLMFVGQAAPDFAAEAAE